MITIVSKEKEKFTFQPQIVQLARGLELYEPDQDIVFEDIITSEFLKTLKAYYEENQYDPEKLKLKTPITTVENSIIEPIYQKAVQNKSIQPFIELLQGADLLRASHFKDLVSKTIATLFYQAGAQEYDIKKYREQWGLPEGETQFPSVGSKPSPFYGYLMDPLVEVYKQKLKAIFNPDQATKEENKKADDDTLAQKIQEQLDMGLEFEEEF